MLKKALTAAVCSILAVTALASCGEKNISVSEETTQAATSTPSSQAAFGDTVMNFTAPQDGEEVIILTIKDYGDIKIKLFPEYADKGVENFKTLAERGYYDGLIFHRIINNFMIQGGDPRGNGTGGESIWGAKFDGGTSPYLIHSAGAVAYANSGSTATDGSQFYIVTGQKYAEEQFAPDYPEAAKKVYIEDGGAPWLDGGYTVFGQVYDGLDIVFKLQQVATGANDKPVTDVVIESMKVAKYDGGELRWHISDYPVSNAETTSEAASDEASSESASDTTTEAEQPASKNETTTSEAAEATSETTTTGTADADTPADAQ
jgi:cyclophilin family peptidyl-prolyl cis-trans isomerase